jgi:hypothetical protein
MRFTRLKNASDMSIRVCHSGAVTHLAPNDEMQNVDVENFAEIREKVTAKHDLGEVNESKGGTRLFD